MADRHRRAGVGVLALASIFMIVAPLERWLDVGRNLQQFGAPLYLGPIMRGLHFAEGKWVLGAGVAAVVVCGFAVVVPRLVVLVAVPAGIVSGAIGHFLSQGTDQVTTWPWVALAAAFVAAAVAGLLWPGGRPTRVILFIGSVSIVAIGPIAGYLIVGSSGGPRPIAEALHGATS